MPGKWLIVCSVVDVSIISLPAGLGILMLPLPVGIIAGLFLASVCFTFLLDAVKLLLFRHLAMV